MEQIDILDHFNQPAFLIDSAGQLVAANHLAKSLWLKQLEHEDSSFAALAARMGFQNPLSSFSDDESIAYCQMMASTPASLVNKQSGAWLRTKKFLNGHDLLLLRLENTVASARLNTIFDLTLQQLIDYLPGNVYWMDSHRYYLGCNQRTLTTLGVTKTQFVGHRLEDILPNCEAVRAAVATDKEVIRERKSVVIKEQPPNVDRAVFLSYKTAICSPDGHACGLFGYSLNIEQLLSGLNDDLLLKQADAALLTGKELASVSEMSMRAVEQHARAASSSEIQNSQTLQAFLQSIVNCMPGNVYWMDRYRRYLGCNRNMLQFMKLTDAKQVVGNTLYDMINFETASRIDAIDRKLLETGEPYQIEERVENHCGIPGNHVTFMTYKAPIFSSTGEIIGMVGISLDITKLKKTEAALKRAKVAAEKANQAKSEFLAMMTHELRTPLNVMLGMTRILQDEPFDEKKRVHYLKTIFTSGQALLYLINNILDFSKAQAGKLELHPQVFSPVEVLNQIEAELALKADEKKLGLVMQHADLPVEVYGDAQRLRQVLYNLTDNAIKYTQTGEVRVTTRLKSQTGDQLIFEFIIQDTGIGIPAERKQQVFEAFTQVRSKAHDEHSRKYGGVGLGLAIVSRMLEVLGGTIQLDSEPGKGSCFTLEIPFGVAHETLKAAAHARQVTLPEKFPDLRVLLVEDNPLNQKVVLHMLKGLACVVKVASNGQEALALLSEGGFDVVLMDISLPDMSGLEITRIHRASEAASTGEHLPIIALTAHAHSEDEEKSRAAGMDAFLVKPVFPEKLREIFQAYTAGP